MKMKICAIVDDNGLEVFDGLEKKIESCFVKMVLQGVNTFVFSNLSVFSLLCLKVATDLKEKFSRIRRFVVKDSKSIEEDYIKLLLVGDVDIVCLSPDLFSVDMSEQDKCKRLIDLSEMVVFFFDEKSESMQKQQLMLEYSLNKEKVVVNLFDWIVILQVLSAYFVLRENFCFVLG